MEEILRQFREAIASWSNARGEVTILAGQLQRQQLLVLPYVIHEVAPLLESCRQGTRFGTGWGAFVLTDDERIRWERSAGSLYLDEEGVREDPHLLPRALEALASLARKKTSELGHEKARLEEWLVAENALSTAQPAAEEKRAILTRAKGLVASLRAEAQALKTETEALLSELDDGDNE